MKKKYFLLAVFLIIIFLSFGILLLNIYQKQNALKEDVIIEQIEETEETSLPIYRYEEKDLLLLNKYQEYNEDVVGLIRVPNTVLNHPMMQTITDEDYYLYKDLDKKYNSHGVPFLSADSLVEGQGGLLIVYGHNIYKRTKDVFADLAGYEDLEFYKSHPIIETVTKSGVRRWLIFAYFIVDNADENPFRYTDKTTFQSKEAHDAFFEEVAVRNWLDVGIEPAMGDTYLLLSSCSKQLSGQGTNRMVVIAKQLYAEEAYEELVEQAKMAQNPLLPQRLR